jgi:hypothetical protein
MLGSRATMSRMKRLPLLAAVTGALLLGSCSQDDGRDLARYYDEQGLFTVDLPAENGLVVTPPQPAQDGPGLLTGVVSSPPAPSPQAQPGFGSSFAPTEQTDQTIYQAFVVTSDGFEDLDEMALYFLTGDPIVDVLVDRHAQLGGETARLVVADVRSDGEVTATVAVALTLGDGQTGYLVAAIFAPGSWEDERSDFERVLRSFRAQVPPGLTTFPVAAEAS